MTEEDWQRFKNFALFKMWLTDKEFDDVAPLFIVFLLVMIGIGVFVWLVCNIIQ